jgi:hypothetical protein
MRISMTSVRALAAVFGLVLTQVAAAANGTLLGIQVDYPRIVFTEGPASQGVSYNGVALTITSTPVFVTFTSGGTDEFVLTGSLNLTANIDAGGVLSGGTFVVNGTVTDTATSTNFSSPLLSGTVNDYGIVDTGGPGGTDLADFRLTATGGSMKNRFLAVNSQAGMVVALEGSGYSGGFAAPWSALRAKGDMGPLPPVPTAPPHTIGYWKNHPEAWPVESMVICGNSLTKTELISVLSTPPRGDKTINMAHQLIAARLNVLVGNSCPLTTNGEAWLCSHGGIGGSRKQWDGGEPIHNELDAFNNGNGDCVL